MEKGFFLKKKRKARVFPGGCGKWSRVGSLKREERKSKGQGSLEEVERGFSGRAFRFKERKTEKGVAENWFEKGTRGLKKEKEEKQSKVGEKKRWRGSGRRGCRVEFWEGEVEGADYEREDSERIFGGGGEAEGEEVCHH